MIGWEGLCKEFNLGWENLWFGLQVFVLLVGKVSIIVVSTTYYFIVLHGVEFELWNVGVASSTKWNISHFIFFILYIMHCILLCVFHISCSIFQRFILNFGIWERRPITFRFSRRRRLKTIALFSRSVPTTIFWHLFSFCVHVSLFILHLLISLSSARCYSNCYFFTCQFSGIRLALFSGSLPRRPPKPKNLPN